jgi:flagellar FliL protein
MAADRRQEDTEEKKGEETKKAFPVKMLVIGLAVLVLLGAAGGGGFWWYTQSAAKKEEAPKPVQAVMWAMDPFVVNLLDNNGERYLKLALQLEVTDPKGIAELDRLKPKLRDNVLDLLSAKSFRELADMAGKQRLREEIAMRLNSFLTTARISKVYFTEFVIQ